MSKPFISGKDRAVDDRLRVHVVVEHDMMRRLLRDLLEHHDCSVASEDSGRETPANVPLHEGDLLVIDQDAFTHSGWRRAADKAGVLVVVVAAEDDPSSREAALAQGVHAWLPRERLGEQLGREIFRIVRETPRSLRNVSRSTYGSKFE